MNIPTEEQTLEWAKAEALQLVDKPTQTRKYILRLLHMLKQRDERIYALENPDVKYDEVRTDP
jgi:hypothetical protein